MESLNRKRIFVKVGILLLIYGILYVVACAPTPKKRRFVRKECLDCHTKFADKYLKMKNVHKVVQEKQIVVFSDRVKEGFIPLVGRDKDSAVIGDHKTRIVEVYFFGC